MDEDLDIHSTLNSDSDDESDSNSDSSDEDSIANLERDTLTWLMYCRAAGSLVHQYIESSRSRIRRFSNARNGCVFMITALEEDPNIDFCEFRMYPPMFVHFTHLLREAYELQSGHDIDIYEQVGMFLFILAHSKGYRQTSPLLGTRISRICTFARVTWRHIKGQTLDIISKNSQSEPNGRHRQFRNPQERFNFNHSSLRNVIERAFGVLKNKWNILDRMPHYCFQKQTAIVVATIAILNFLCHVGQVDETFQTVEEVVEAGEIDLSYE
ncbi:Uncharacterized protein Adt_03906 [Abeliophyllum distichum]|uniref:DDE Tnp4 domain-containing protein n=1 Tax=Abeliophyllum distichum TaxID=126358 RepID=A0ABD1W286_9LAMI